MTVDQAAKYSLDEIIINGEDVSGLFMHLEIFENIFIGGVTGSISIADSDSQGFIEKNDIEFIEEISFTFKNINDEELKFDGFMNGLRDEYTKNQLKVYIIDFTSKAVRKNEMVHINTAFKDITPDEIAKQMIEEKLESTMITPSSYDKGEPLNWVAGNRKPIDVIKYVVNHGVTSNSNYEGGDEEEGKASGTCGYLCWETLDGYRYAAMDDLLQENTFSETHTNYKNYLANTNASKDVKFKTIIVHEFPKCGDYFEKLRSGAVKSDLVSFDMDKGIYTKFKYEADNKVVTDKALGGTTDITRTLVRFFTNEKFTNTCTKAQADHGDQSRKQLPQTIARQNTFSDVQGRVTLPPQFTMRAGDIIDLAIEKVHLEDTEEGPAKKHTGKYLISQVGHHVFREGYAYTRLALIRTPTKQKEEEAQGA